MKPSSRHLDLLGILVLAALVPQISCVVPGRILEDDVDVGVGTAEEVPISSFTLTFSEPDLQIQRALPAPIIVRQKSQPQQEPVYDDLEEDYADEEESNFNGGTGEGSIESIPIESMRVRFEPAKFESTKLDSIEEEQNEQQKQPLQCTERCELPVMPDAMVVAAKHCNVELVFHRPDFPVHFDNNSRTGRPTQEREPRRLDTSLRTACGSKCVLAQLNFLRDSGVPDAEAVTRLLKENSDPAWETAMLAARDTCTPLTVYPAGQVLEEKERCQLATTFMKCIRNTLTENCPAEFRNKECQALEQETIEEEESSVN